MRCGVPAPRFSEPRQVRLRAGLLPSARKRSSRNSKAELCSGRRRARQGSRLPCERASAGGKTERASASPTGPNERPAVHWVSSFKSPVAARHFTTAATARPVLRHKSNPVVALIAWNESIRLGCGEVVRGDAFGQLVPGGLSEIGFELNPVAPPH